MADLTGDGVNDVDITHAGDSTTIGGAIFTDAVKVGSGTGGYNTFLAIQDNNDAGASEAGFNSDDTPPLDTTNVEMDQAKTHTVLLSSLVVKTVVVNGVPQQFYEFRVDLNEANSGIESNLSLDQFKLYSSSNPDIESLTNNTVNKDGEFWLNQTRLPDTNALFELLKKEAVKLPQPAVYVRGDQTARYEAVGKVIYTAQRAGIQKVGFITEPPDKG